MLCLKENFCVLMCIIYRILVFLAEEFEQTGKKLEAKVYEMLQLQVRLTCLLVLTGCRSLIFRDEPQLGLEVRQVGNHWSQ